MCVNNENTADNTIGFIPIVNSISASLGLGLPWLLLACVYGLDKGQSFRIENAEVFCFPLVLLLVANLVCVGLLMLRRRLGSAELGGSEKSKIFSFLFLFFIWIGFIISNLN